MISDFELKLQTVYMYMWWIQHLLLRRRRRRHLRRRHRRFNNPQKIMFTLFIRHLCTFAISLSLLLCVFLFLSLLIFLSFVIRVLMRFSPHRSNHFYNFATRINLFFSSDSSFFFWFSPLFLCYTAVSSFWFDFFLFAVYTTQSVFHWYVAKCAHFVLRCS